MKKIAIPGILLCHCLGMMIYFWRMSHDPTGVYWYQYGWTLFFDCANILPLILLSFLLVFSDKRGLFDKQFLFIEATFSTSLFLAFIFQYIGLIKHTYGYQISIGGIAITTFFIIFNIIKYDYHKS